MAIRFRPSIGGIRRDRTTKDSERRSFQCWQVAPGLIACIADSIAQIRSQCSACRRMHLGGMIPGCHRQDWYNYRLLKTLKPLRISIGVFKVLSVWSGLPMNVVPTVTTISKSMPLTLVRWLSAHILRRQRWNGVHRRRTPDGRVWNLPLPCAKAHHRRATRGSTGDHLDTERSVSRHTLRIFLSLLATSPLSSHLPGQVRI